MSSGITMMTACAAAAWSVLTRRTTGSLDGRAKVVAGYAAPGLIGEAWANFGWAGVGLFAALGAFAGRLAALLQRRRGQADLVAAALLVLFLARTHALGLGGLGVLVPLVAAWWLMVAGREGLFRSLRRTFSWRPPS